MPPSGQGGAAPPSAKTSAKGRKGLFLRFTSKEDTRLIKARQLLDIFEGALPVKFFYEDTRQYETRPGADWNPVLARALHDLLGHENVVVNL